MTAATLQTALDTLARMNCKPAKSGDGWKAYCPVHETDGKGHKPSLTLRQGDRQAVVLNCHAGCDSLAILKALGMNGAPRPSKEPVAIYPYRNAEGSEVRQKLRFEPKNFRIRHKDAATGEWVYKAGNGPAVLYRLPELKTAIAEGRTVFVVEGEKDADRLAALALAATTNIEGAAQPNQRAKWRKDYTEQLRGAARVILLPDNDAPGRAHMAHVAQELAGKVADIRVLELPGLPDKGDVSDWLNAGHTVEELEALADQAKPAASTAPPEEADIPEPTATSQRKVTLNVVAGDFPELVDETESALIAHEPNLFQRSNELVRVIVSRAETVHGISRPRGKLLIAPLDAESLLDKLNRCIRWQRWNLRKSDWKPCNAPRPVATALLARCGEWRVPHLVGVVTAPTLRPDGTVIEKPGYDAATGLLLVPNGADFPPLPARPTRDHGRAALDFIHEEVLSGFPFAETHDRSAALSAILTACIRHALRTAPLHAFDAPRAGSGKSLLADVVALIATGGTATHMSFAPEPDEMRKRILAVLMQGDSVINLDNIEGPLHGESLCTALTGETFSERLLGVNRTATAPTTCTWLATGNNLILQGDMTRRVIPCQLDPQCERPEERRFNRNLHEWIPPNRPALVAAALTALRAYIAAGKPRQAIAPFGSFEDWSDTVRSALVWLGEADPNLGRSRLETTDPIRAKLRGLLLAWYSAFKTAPATAKELIGEANKTCWDAGNEVRSNPALFDVLSEHFSDRRGEISGHFIGQFLKRYARRIEQGARLEAIEKSGIRQKWRVAIVDRQSFDAAANLIS